MPQLTQTNNDVFQQLQTMNEPKSGGGGGGSQASFTPRGSDCSVLPEGSPERAACQAEQSSKAQNKNRTEEQRPSPTPQPSATPATPPTKPAPAAPTLTGSDLAEANRLKAIGAQGRSPTPPAQTPAAVAPATPATAPTAVTVDPLNQLKKRYEDALMMPMSADPQTAQQQRGYLESLKKELNRAMSGSMGQGMEAGAVRLQQQSQARNEATHEVTNRKADQDAAAVRHQAEQYWKSKGTEMPKGWMEQNGYTEDGHKLGKNIFTQKDQANKKKADTNTLTQLMRGGVLGGIFGQQGHQVAQGNGPDLAKPAPPGFQPINAQQSAQPKTNSVDGTKSQLQQMYKAGFIDEAAFRKGMNDPYGHGHTIEKIYDEYVKQFNPQQPHSPFPENSA